MRGLRDMDKKEKDFLIAQRGEMQGRASELGETELA